MAARQVNVGGVPIGAGAPISVQSMTNTPTTDVERTVAQIARLTEAGCEIVRCSVPDQASVESFSEIKRRLRVDGNLIPMVADVHFDYRLALGVIKGGADKIRFNPGNIGPAGRALEVSQAARDAGIPVRVGVNAGSLRKEFMPAHAHESDGKSHDRSEVIAATAQALVNSALWGAELVESTGHKDIVISVKASSVQVMIEAYRRLAKATDCPLHLGLTEAGTTLAGAVKSAVALGVLLEEGIGDTLRVSLAADPTDEVKVAYDILGSLGLRRRGVDIIACPTCARCDINLIELAESVERDLAHLKQPISVAVMGCVVNGPGEAREADVGIAAGKGEGLIFVGGEIVDKVPEHELRRALHDRVNLLLAQRDNA